MAENEESYPTYYDERKEFDQQVTDNAELQSSRDEVETLLRQMQLENRPADDNISNKSSRISACSSISTKKLELAERQAELKVRKESLDQLRKIRQAEIDLALQKEEIEIETQIKTATEKQRIIQQFEVGDMHVQTPIPEPHFSELRPDAPSFRSQVPGTSKLHENRNSVGFKADHFAPQVHSIPSWEQTEPHHYINRNDSRMYRLGPRQASDIDTGLEEALKASLSLSRLPTPEPETFAGETLSYVKWKMSFKTLIEARQLNIPERMYYLQHYLSGQARKAVEGFLYNCTEESYQAAWNVLEERYGSKFKIQEAFREKLTRWPKIGPKDSGRLLEYSDYLKVCRDAMGSIHGLKILNDCQENQKLVAKLPDYIASRWNRQVCQCLEETQEFPTFSKFVDFVAKESMIATNPVTSFAALKAKEVRNLSDPIYGKSALSSSVVDDKSHTSQIRSRTFRTAGVKTLATHVNRGEFESQNQEKETKTHVCIVCKSLSHDVETCKVLLGVPREERIEKLKKLGACYGCLKLGHITKNCKNRSTCHSCKGRHPTVLHDPTYVRRGESQNETHVKKTELQPERPQTEITGFTRAGNAECTMAIVPVRVRKANSIKSVITYAFLDPGSSASFCTESLAKEIGSSGRPIKIEVGTMGNTFTMDTQIISGLEITDTENKFKIPLPDVYTKDVMPVSKRHIPTCDDIIDFPHLNDVDLPTFDCEIGLLIGNNVPDIYTPIEVRAGPRGTPHATRTAIGWIPWNVVRYHNKDHSDVPVVNRAEVISIQEREQLRDLDNLVKTMINTDFPERIIEDKREHSLEDKQFLAKASNSISHQEGHYYVGLPFKGDCQLPNNYEHAKSRLQGLKRKMMRNREYQTHYNNFMKDLIDKGYAEKVPDNEVSRQDGKVWYIPHHGVYHHVKKKIRVVFDCAAKWQGISLNQQLLQGPNLTNSLFGVLLRFREQQTALMADIEAMFHQVRVNKEDTDYLRFLWWPSEDYSKEPEVYRMLVHLFGSTSSPSCSNYALRRTATDNRSQYDDDVIECILKNFYVDDFLKSVRSTKDAITLAKNLTELCHKGGFNLVKWASNDKDVILALPEERRASTVKEFDVKSELLPTERALGMAWNMQEDIFSFKTSLEDKVPVTKRTILSVTSSAYDPLGLVAPYILPAKIMLQELCRRGIDWDEVVPEDIQMKWQKWLKELHFVEKLPVPRCLTPISLGEIVDTQLHHFADSSEVGYGTASYIRHRSVEGNVHCSLLVGKARVVPLKKITIPRLELTAAKLSVCMNKVITDELTMNIDRIFYWTDSMSVLKYIQNESTRFHTFVANRLAVIHDGSKKEQWHYVKSEHNPADYASRGLSPQDEEGKRRWLEGPEFLSKPEQYWPTSQQRSYQLDAEDPEVKRERKTVMASLAVEPSTSIEQYVLGKFSSWKSIRSILAYVILYLDGLKRWSTRRAELTEKFSAKYLDPIELQNAVNKIVTDEKEKLLHSSQTVRQVHLNPELIRRAEVLVMKSAQGNAFTEQIKCLQSNKAINKRDPLCKLDPVLEDGLLRVGGRLDRASISFDQRHPIIVPGKSKLARILVEHVHRSVGHLGKNSVLSKLREQYWLLGHGKLIKEIISKCVICRKYSSKPTEQKMAELPTARVVGCEPPFTRTGVDYFGPFEVKQGRSVVKRYGVIFTCLQIRAIHIEVADSLDTDSCINAIRRFIARRGQVLFMYSDNGTNLTSAEKELRLEESRIKEMCTQQGIKWSFNPPSGSHFGGVWERLIRSIRKVLNGVLKEQVIKMNDDGLRTLFCEVEAILNSRPLTDVSSDPKDLTPLTPNDLLLLKGTAGPPGRFEKTDSYVRRRWRQVQYLADIFWKRWKCEYLCLLQERQKWRDVHRNTKIGDIVLIVDNAPRNNWALARVIDVKADKHGLVRVATVQTESTTLERPIDKLVLVLEAQ